jgi:hypothetical protein
MPISFCFFFFPTFAVRQYVWCSLLRWKISRTQLNIQPTAVAALAPKYCSVGCHHAAAISVGRPGQLFFFETNEPWRIFFFNSISVLYIERAVPLITFLFFYYIIHQHNKPPMKHWYMIICYLFYLVSLSFMISCQVLISTSVGHIQM